MGPPALLSLPPEIIHQILFFAACPSFYGPPVLTPILLVCKFLNSFVTQSPSLYARIFKFKFSSSAIARRAFDPLPVEYRYQLIQYSRALRTIKSGRISELNNADDLENEDELDILNVLWIAHLMLLDDDGHNSAQLDHVGAYGWVERFIRENLHEGSDTLKGWPAETAANSAALFIYWGLTTQDRLNAESQEQSDSMCQLIMPFALIPFRYSSTFVPANHFHLPLQTPVHEHMNRSTHAVSFGTRHGPYPPFLTHNIQPVANFHFRHMDFLHPPCAQSAIMLLVARRQRKWELVPHLPPTREIAIATRRAGPTIADMEELNGDSSHVDPRFPGGVVLPALGFPDAEESQLRSTLRDTEFNRSRMCLSPWGNAPRGTLLYDDGPGGNLRIRAGPVYEVGSLTGLFFGRMFHPDHAHMLNLLQSDQELYDEPPPPDGTVDRTPARMPTNLDARLNPAMMPIYMRLQEHVVYAPGGVIPCGGTVPTTGDRASNLTPELMEAESDQGLLNAWFPRCMATEFRQSLVQPAGSPESIDIPTKPGHTIHITFPHHPTLHEQNFVYQTIEKTKLDPSEPMPESSPPIHTSAMALPQAGTFHDRDICPGCKLRTEAARSVRRLRSKRESPASSVDSLTSQSSDDENEVLFQSLGLGYLPSPNTSDEGDGDVDMSSGNQDDEADPNERDIDAGVDGPTPHDPYLIPPCNGVQDIIITGETDPRHSAAWNHFTFMGRIRNKDGLIAILRTPPRPDQGKVIFYGYIQDGKNFVGRWRILGGMDVHTPGVEGVFCMSRRE